MVYGGKAKDGKKYLNIDRSAACPARLQQVLAG